jgi:uncharacterized protein (DUF169 family)
MEINPDNITVTLSFEEAKDLVSNLEYINSNEINLTTSKFLSELSTICYS